MSWINDLLGKKEISKEAELTDATQEFQKKVKASDWLQGSMAIDIEQVEKEYNANLEAEAKALGKTAAYSSFETQDETLKKDLTRDVKILSDYCLSEMLMEIRGYKAQNLPENYVELKEKSKADVKASREKCEKELLDSMAVNAQIDWQAAFQKYSKEAKPEEPKESDIFQPKLDNIDEKEWSTGKKDDKDFVISDKEKTTQAGAGNGREADERTDVTKQPGELQDKKASLKVDAFLVRDPDYDLHVGSKIVLARSIMSKEGTILDAGGEYEITGTEGERYIITSNDKSYTACRFDTPKFFVTAEKVKDNADKDKGNQALPEGKETSGDKPSEAVDGTTLPADKKEVGDKADRAEEKNSYDKGEKVEEIEAVNKKAHNGTDHVAEMCPVCGGEGKDLVNGENDHYSCMGCGISYGHKQGSCGHCGSISSHASKEDVLKIIKQAEVSSPWEVVTDPVTGVESIARVERQTNTKESEEDLEKELQK